jgi:hypothetical protein
MVDRGDRHSHCKAGFGRGQELSEFLGIFASIGETLVEAADADITLIVAFEPANDLDQLRFCFSKEAYPHARPSVEAIQFFADLGQGGRIVDEFSDRLKFDGGQQLDGAGLLGSGEGCRKFCGRRGGGRGR